MLKKVLILWWTDGFWKWLAEFAWKHFSEKIELYITGRNIVKGEKVAQELRINFTHDNKKYISQADIVVFSVPIWHMENTILELAPLIKSSATVIDVCSVKSMPSRLLKKHCPSWCTIIPTHPMFGPFVSSIAGQIIVLTSDTVGKSHPHYKKLQRFLESQSAKVIETSPQEHDKMMAVIQGLTHFDMFVFGETLRRLNFDIAESFNFVSPVYKIIISSVARYIGQNPKLYSDIQIHNPEVLTVHNTFMEVTQHYNNIVKEWDEKAFIETADKSHQFFGEANTQAGQKYTDKIIYLLWLQTQYAKESIWKEIQICNIYNKQSISWILKKFENNNLQLDNGKEYDIDEWEIIFKN